MLGCFRSAEKVPMNEMRARGEVMVESGAGPARKNVEEASDQFRAILNGLPALIGFWDTSLRNRSANDAYLEYFGFTPDQMRGLHISEVLGDELYEANLPYMKRALAGAPQLFDCEIVDMQRRWRYTQTSYIPEIIDGAVRGFLVLVTDITERREAEIALDDERRRIATVLDAIHDAVISVDQSLRITSANRSAAAMIGRSPADLIGQTLSSVADVRSRLGDTELDARCLEAIAHDRSVSVDNTCQLVSTSGQTRSVDFLVTPLHTSRGRCGGLVITMRDVTDSRRLLEETRHLAYHDPLTGLLNREHLRSVELGPNTCVLFCDLDGFKQANDACGHQVGDKILFELANVLRRGVRSSDDLVRIGGDEFVVLLSHTTERDAIRIAENLVKSVAASRFASDGRDFSITMSIGVAPRGTSADIHEMIHEADQACYAAKRTGGNRVASAGERVPQLAQ
jgi:diguanylate cyclase (GGDEF)-like protein/PAS domain S-box-containing protein